MFTASKRAFSLILVVLSFLVLLGAGNAGVRSTTKSASLTGIATWPAGTGDPQTWAITGTFNGLLGYGTYFGRLTVTTSAAEVSCALDVTNMCQPATGQIVFSTNKGTVRAVSDPTIRPVSAPAGVAGGIGSSTFSREQFQFDLVVTGGTGKYAHASGQLSLSYDSYWSRYFDGSNFVYVSAIGDTGTVSGKVTT